MSRHHSLRASDADREAVVERLREAAGEGRLEPVELEQRVHIALRARTYGDLAALLADLPGDGTVRLPHAGGRTNPVAHRAAVGAGFLVAATVAVALVALVAMFVLGAAALWIALVLCCRICWASWRRLVSGSPARHPMSVRRPQRPRPTGFL